MKKTTSMILVLVLTLSMLWGCGQADGTVVTVDSGGKGKTTLNFFANKWEENNVRVMEKLITEFMKENKDIKVVYESMKGNEYYEVLKKRMLSGNGDDVFMVNHDTSRILKGKDLLVNLADSPVVSQDSVNCFSEKRKQTSPLIISRFSTQFIILHLSLYFYTF